ncbi:winged helix-turn-helix transcriptional regulator [Massilibacteroides sp.]|uniref:winged helix-turn-helix transcriptional regulator n=1 Tax=Massilibacteroides sp. TaxID=2034766 RepID=UPI0034238F39
MFSSVDVIGGKWKPVIIWVLLDGAMRFGELHQSINGIALKVLIQYYIYQKNIGLSQNKKNRKSDKFNHFSCLVAHRGVEPLFQE